MSLALSAKDAMPDGGVITITTGFAKTDDVFVLLQSSGKGEKYALTIRYRHGYWHGRKDKVTHI